MNLIIEFEVKLIPPDVMKPNTMVPIQEELTYHFEVERKLLKHLDEKNIIKITENLKQFLLKNTNHNEQN